MQTIAGWDAIANGYDRYATACNIGLVDMLLDRMDLGPGVRLLDVAAGTGALALPAARRGASVVAVDLAPAMIERLRARTTGAGLSSVDSRIMDGEALEFDDDTFDVAVSVNGVSLFADVAAGLRELARVTRPGGSVLVAAPGPRRQAECVTFWLGALQVAVPEAVPPLDAMSLPFRLADPDVMHRGLRAAGLTDVHVEPLRWELRFESARRFLDLVTTSDPITAEVAAGLTRSQLADIRYVLDGMFRERSGGSPAALLTNAMNVGVASVPRSPAVEGDQDAHP